MRGHRNDRDVRAARPFALPDRDRGGEAVDVGHLDVHQHQVERLARRGQHVQRDAAVRRGLDAVAALLQRADGERLIHRVVFGDEDAQRAPGGLLCRHSRVPARAGDPFAQDRDDRIEEIRLFDGFRDVQRHTEAAAAGDVVGTRRRGQHDDGQRLKAAVGLDAFDEHEAVDAGHLTVDNRERERPVLPMRGLERDEGVVRVRDDRRLHPPVLQRVFEDPPIRRVVVDGEHGKILQVGPARLRHGRRRFGRRVARAIEPRGEMKRAAGADLAVDPDRAAHQRHELGCDRQAQARAAERSRRR